MSTKIPIQRKFVSVWGILIISFRLKHPKRDPMRQKELKVLKEPLNHQVLETILDQLIHWEFRFQRA